MSQQEKSGLNAKTNNGSGKEQMGLAGRMAASFIHSPLSPLIFFAMLAMGILGLIFTPRQEDPQISVPMVDIFLQYPGASSEQVASLAIDPLERIMSEIPGVKHVYSASMRGEGMVTVRFEVGERLGPSIVKVHDKIQSNLDRIPPGVGMPLVKPKGIDDVPVVTLTLWSDSVDDGVLRTLGLDLLQRLKQIPDTGQGFVVGGRAEQVRIEVLPERLAGYGVSLEQVANTIRTANGEQLAGSMESGNRFFSVYTGSFLRTPDEISRLVVATHNDMPVYVRDVANVFQGPEEAQKLVHYYTGHAHGGENLDEGVPAVTLALAKKEGSNGVTVANAIIAKLEGLKGRLIPDNVNVSITRNYGHTADQKVNELIFKLFVATAAVALLVWLSLGVRPAMVVLLVIPVVILITVFSAWVLGFTIDRVSLFALIFSIGILVDDAIVVIENIYRRWLEKGSMDTATAVDAVREVGDPTILATFTVIAALLPMGFVSGMMGPYMAPIPALGSVAMLFSLFAAFIFTPWLAMRIRPSMDALHKAEARENRQSDWLEGLFRGILTPIIQNRRLGLATLFTIIALFFISCTFFYTKWVAVKMLPLDNKPEFSVMVDMPEGTALPVTANLVARFAEKVRSLPEVTAVQSYAGTAAPFDFNGMVRHYYLRDEPWQGELHVQLLDKTERKRSSHEIAVETREMLAGMAERQGARITVVEMPPGPPVLQAMVAEIYGPDAETRREVAARMTQLFDEADNVVDVDNYLQHPHDIWRFEVDTEKSVRRGISVDTINRNLAMAMGGYRLGDIKLGSLVDPTYIVIQVPLASRAQITRLANLPIPSRDGITVPLAELGRFVVVKQDPIIYHKDLRPVEYVVGEAAGRLGAPIYGMFAIEERFEEYTTPDGVVLSGHMLGAPEDNGKSAFEWTGEWTVTYETFRDMGAAFGVALILIYILVVWEFGNFLVPAVIMAPIPLTLIGIIPGHWLMGADFTATSMIGFIALAGIIVRNSILLVDFSRHQVQQGTDVRDAVILSCKTRTRPILITALALVAGSSVILTDPIFQGMAISLLFGVLVSTLLTLVVIPLGCISAGAAFCPAENNRGCDSANATATAAQAPSGKSRIKRAGKLTAQLFTDVSRDFANDIRGWGLSLLKLLRLLKQKLNERLSGKRQASLATKSMSSASEVVVEAVPEATASNEESDDSGKRPADPEAAVEKDEPAQTAKKTVAKKAPAKRAATTKKSEGGSDSAKASTKTVVEKDEPARTTKKTVAKKAPAKRTATTKEGKSGSDSVKAGAKTAVGKDKPAQTTKGAAGKTIPAKRTVTAKKKVVSKKSPAKATSAPRQPVKSSTAKRRGIRLKPTLGTGSTEGEDEK